MKKEEKSWNFYDTKFSRNDVLFLIKNEDNEKEFRKYIEEKILNTWSKEEASDSRNEVFLDFLCNLYCFTNEISLSAE